MNKPSIKRPSATASFLVLMIAICSMNAWQLVLPNFAYDNSFGIAAAKNIYDGKGYSLTRISIGDLSGTHYEPLNKWPPGYSWMLVAVKRLTGADWIISCYILNALGVTLLILALRKILLLLNIPVWIVNIYLLFTGFVPYPFLSIWFSDLLALAFFMWAIAFLLNMIVKNKNLFICAAAAAILLGYCAWLKYLYLSISLVPVIFLLVYAWKKNKANLVRTFACTGIFLTASIIGLLWFQQHHTGSALYINPTGSGFFPENLLHLAPVVPGSLIDFNLFDMQLSALLHIPYLKMIIFWKWLNAFLLLAMCFLIVRFYREKGFHFGRPLNIYMNLAIAVSVSICLLLMGLSLTQDRFFNRYTAYWTYVQELRYYALVLIFIPQGILFLIVYQSRLLSRVKSLFTVIIGLIVVIQISHGIYYLPKQILIKRQFGKNRTSEQLDFLALKTAKALSDQGEKLIIYSNDYEMANIASLSGAPVLYDDDSLGGNLHSATPVTLLVLLNRREESSYKHFLSAYNPKLLLVFKNPYTEGADTDFYLLRIPGTDSFTGLAKPSLLKQNLRSQITASAPEQKPFVLIKKTPVHL